MDDPRRGEHRWAEAKRRIRRRELRAAIVGTLLLLVWVGLRSFGGPSRGGNLVPMLVFYAAGTGLWWISIFVRYWRRRPDS